MRKRLFLGTWLAACATVGAGVEARVRSLYPAGQIADTMRQKTARPGNCPIVPAAFCLRRGAPIPIVRGDCRVVKDRGLARCGAPSAYFCGVGFVPLYRAAQTRSFYYREQDHTEFDHRMGRWRKKTGFGPAFHGGILRLTRMRPWGGRHWFKAAYCVELRHVLGLFASGAQLAKKLDDDAGLIGRWNSTFGNSPNLKTLRKRLAEKRAALQSEYRHFLLNELTRKTLPPSHYVGRVTELNRLLAVFEGLSERTQRAGRDIIRTAERGAKLAKKVQRVLIKVAGRIVWAFTGGNKIAQCLTEAGIESAANAVTEKLNGNELTIGGFGKSALRTLIFRCADALLSGPGADVLDVIVGPFKAILERFGDLLRAKVKSKVRALWKRISGKVASVVRKLEFLMGKELVEALTHSSTEVVVEFAGAAIPACLFPLVKRNFQELFRCLGRAARRGLERGIPLGLFDAAMDLLARDAPKAAAGLQKLANKLGVGDDASVRMLVRGLGAVAGQAVRAARGCRKHVQGLSSARTVFRCLAKALVTKARKLGPAVLLGALQNALETRADRVVRELRRQRAALVGGLGALGISLPAPLAEILRGGAAAATGAFGKAVRKCAPKLAGSGPVRERLRAAVRCAGDAARRALAKGGRKLVRGAVAKAKRAIVRTVVGQAAAAAVRIVGATSLNALLWRLAKLVHGMAGAGDVTAFAEALVKRVRDVGGALRLPVRGLPLPSEVAAAFRKDARRVARRAEACVQALRRASVAAARRHESLRSMARLLVKPLRALPPCLRSAVKNGTTSGRAGSKRRHGGRTAKGRRGAKRR